jgi:hypothetical protein
MIQTIFRFPVFLSSMFSPFFHTLYSWLKVSACMCVYCHRTDWPCPIDHNNYKMWSLLRKELYMAILLTRAEKEQILLFGLLEEWSREFWFIGGRYTWILVYWRKGHVKFADDLAMEAGMSITYVSVQISWLLFSPNIHPIVCFLRVVFRIQWPSQMWRQSRVKADYVRRYSYRYPR